MNEVYDAEIMLAKEKIRDVVNRYDPMGLLDICPEDDILTLKPYETVIFRLS